MSFPVGTKLGPYEILAPLGAGGMGEVYRARDTRLKRDVALKVLPDDFADDPARQRRFEQEARVVAALNHPNIVAVYDVGENFLVSELVDGQTLRHAGKLSQRQAIDLAVQIAEGLAAAHAAGITHRDLKPDNIMVTRDGRAKILDFGLAKIAQTADAGSQAPTETQDGMIMGTVGYMSPEQVKGQPADSRSDIFSFGVVLYEMLAGRRAFTGGSSMEVMSAILKEAPLELPESIPASAEEDRRALSRQESGPALSIRSRSGVRFTDARAASLARAAFGDVRAGLDDRRRYRDRGDFDRGHSFSVARPRAGVVDWRDAGRSGDGAQSAAVSRRTPAGVRGHGGRTHAGRGDEAGVRQLDRPDARSHARAGRQHRVGLRTER